jgi:hypothetical protein
MKTNEAFWPSGTTENAWLMLFWAEGTASLIILVGLEIAHSELEVQAAA